uniref:Zinc finger protein 580 n=1 Tax=Macaca fascicularis TaxID=9541 RepID=A0A7N9CZH5_MACFA
MEKSMIRCSCVEQLPLQMLLLPPRPPHPRSSSPEAMDPPPPKAPPFPKAEGPSSTPSSAAGPRPRGWAATSSSTPMGSPTHTRCSWRRSPGPAPARGAPGEPGPRKGYSCPECARVFASPLRLQSHRVSHSDLKPFTCGACGRPSSAPATCRGIAPRTAPAPGRRTPARSAHAASKTPRSWRSTCASTKLETRLELPCPSQGHEV